MANTDHYRTLEISPTATQAEIKQAYRRLAKLFHPDSNRDTANHDKIAKVNAAYEVLGDPQSRQSYDQQRHYRAELEAAGFTVDGDRGSPEDRLRQRQRRSAAAQSRHRTHQQAAQQADEHLQQWLKQVYTPVNRLLHKILDSLTDQVDELAADPFDDELMQNFLDYLEDCRDWLNQAETIFCSVPNPPNVAGAAASLFYCLSQVGDGIEQLEFFTTNYDEYYLHTGQELFRIAKGLRLEAEDAVRAIAA
ncbi:MAG: J domain-containing protein [Leptolyngbyaceae cyanobacterium RU_5_1]|nr:J domain-containing protein [Leptolyngbyaceae cyanobacterium RU_5_1]